MKTNLIYERVLNKLLLLENSDFDLNDLAAIQSFDRDGVISVIVYSISNVRSKINLLKELLRGYFDDNSRERNFFVDEIIKGVIAIVEEDPYSGNCRGAWSITRIAHNRKSPGFGINILYPIAFALTPTGMIMPDRGIVKPGAANAWKKMYSFKKSYPLDDKGQHDQHNNSLSDHPNHTEDPSDDCITTHSAEYLNSAYEADGTEKMILSQLLSNHQQFISEIDGSNLGYYSLSKFIEFFEKKLITYEQLFFMKHFRGQ
jgi:hypothetical protein